MAGTGQIGGNESGTTSAPLWRNRDFVLLWSANSASTLGAQVSSVAYPLIALELTGSAVQAGLIGTVGPVAAGSIIERWGATAALLAIGLVMLIVAAGTTLSRTIRHMPSLADATQADP
ncbi:hypothetical protein [Streptosporangium sp. NPDC087985]|uniref:hypothetical protein n=1 Tax=Streptosporangium sp. NPDC087985 TaxID=3366196 RepID=UPI0037FBB924